jgi:hypothetical protein
MTDYYSKYLKYKYKYITAKQIDPQLGGGGKEINLCLISFRPDNRLLEFYSRFPEHFNLYLIADDETYLLPKRFRKRFTWVQLSAKTVSQAGFQYCYDYNFIKRRLKGRTSAGWDKAMYYFTMKQLLNNPVWFVEEDVFVHSHEAIEILNKKCGNADLVVKSKHQMGSWPHWPNGKDLTLLQKTVNSTSVDLYASMHCICRVSSKLFTQVRAVASKARRLFLLEFLLPTLADRFNLSIVNPAELESIEWQYDWQYDDIDANNIYHPVKDIGVQTSWRKKLKPNKESLPPNILTKKYPFVAKENLTFNVVSKNYRNVWIFAGLRRSGNHLAISWLISSLPKNSVYFFNDVYIKGFNGSLSVYNLDNQFNPMIGKKIASLKEFRTNKEVKDLIISVEDKNLAQIDALYQELQPRCESIKKVLVIRDVLNLMASRIKHVESTKGKQEMYADATTIDYWKQYHKEAFSPKTSYLVANYNLFVRDIQYYDTTVNKTKNKKGKTDTVLKLKDKPPKTFYLKTFANQLGIDVSKTLVTTPGYGGGSSFGTKTGAKQETYLERWKLYKNHPLIKRLLNDPEIREILLQKYLMALSK